MSEMYNVEHITKIFDGKQLRIFHDGEPKFLLRDLCDILEIGHAATVRKRLDEDVVYNHPLETAGGTQLAIYVDEAGLYDVVLDSRKPEAKRFRKWITSEVLPSIRKHGAYMTPETIEQALLNPDTIIQLATNLKEEQQKRRQLEEQKKRDEPYTTFGKVVATSDASINVGAFAKLLYDAHGIKIGRNNLFKWLRNNGYLMKGGRERNQPKQKYIEQGLFETTVTLIKKPKGDIESITTMVTGKGQVFLAKKLREEMEVAT